MILNTKKPGKASCCDWQHTDSYTVYAPLLQGQPSSIRNDKTTPRSHSQASLPGRAYYTGYSICGATVKQGRTVEADGPNTKCGSVSTTTMAPRPAGSCRRKGWAT